MAILIAADELEEQGVVELKRAEGLTLVLDTPKGTLASISFFYLSKLFYRTRCICRS